MRRRIVAGTIGLLLLAASVMAAGADALEIGSVTGVAPPGDIHRVRNHASEVAISLHVYGADIARLGSSVRRIYDLPVLTPVP